MICNICSKTFSRKDSYERHMISTMHKNNERNAKIRRYICGCGKSYFHNPSLHRHKQTCTKQNQASLSDVQNKQIQELHDKMNLIEKENEELRQKMNEIEHPIELAPLSTIQYRMKRNVNKKTRNDVYSNQTGLCGMCEIKLPPYFQVDHIVALQFGGNNETDNLMALCCDCHAKKSFTENACRVQIRETVSKILKQYT